ncbi:hypothetical protein K456DRAFT_32466 [Colletotrichum gloeosporioides 23]|nr:hypothetical protein K456DRAFT_32466 [Colletotrichum gloeosporioides 23]
MQISYLHDQYWRLTQSRDMHSRTQQRHTLSCLVLLESLGLGNTPAFTIRIPTDKDSRTFAKTLRDTYQQTLTRFGRFFQTYIKLQGLTVYRVALHDISVPNLDSLPTTKALVKNAVRDEALTAALGNPEHMCWSCYNCLFGLYENLFVRIEKRDGRIRVPMYALMIRWETRPIANVLLFSLVSIGAIFLAESARIVLDL